VDQSLQGSKAGNAHFCDPSLTGRVTLVKGGFQISGEQHLGSYM